MNITPTLVVLLQELERFNKLIALISQTLNLLRKALAGEIGMNTVLDEVANALYNGQIPNYWRKLAPDTTKTLPYWIEQLIHRASQYRYWFSSGEPLVMWLPGKLWLWTDRYFFLIGHSIFSNTEVLIETCPVILKLLRSLPLRLTH